MTTFCSDSSIEPLVGTAKTGTTYVLVEHPGPWSKDILDGGTFSPELTAELKKLPGLYLIRKPGRIGRMRRELKRAYLIFSELGIAETLSVRSYEDLLTLDLTGPGRNNMRGATKLDEPILLVCTHSKRDICCAVKGIPIAKSLVDEFPHAHIWECSHAKGHRFAPALVQMPHNYAFGRLNEHAAKQLYRTVYLGQFYVPGARGRGIYSPADQVAEVAVAQQLIERGEALSLGQLSVADSVVTHTDGRQWKVLVERIAVDNVLPSCGTAPKPGKAWVARSITGLG
ncbi:Sucrase ferredoxin-like protein [Corynebacterium kutscheri]|uniref:sucrase ferredoxin n=1 Tax=Corynebacterium kutscheri TaxID=35755 RepID=UPI000F714772|nr:sucrase ferredoxin [Corynebacterium kutscheri]VEH80486.1 Sucrase ferredoxin-like protein [Corynebacterium kutscheri]